MNWLDWGLVVFFAFAAYKGFTRGFIIELASLVALVAGIWAGIHLSDRVVEAIGLETDSAAIAFLVTFLIVLLGVHLIARFLTKLIDIAQLSIPNKLAGIAFGVLRSAFTWSIALSLIGSYSDDAVPPQEVRENAVLYEPVKALSPILLPALKENKWVKRTMNEMKSEVDRVIEH